MSFFPLDKKILKSSIYLLGTAVEWKVWTHLMLTADPRTGSLDEAAWVIARDTNLPEADVEACLVTFSGPDPRSRTKTDDGMKIVREGSKITLINYMQHRDKDHSTPRVARFREKKRSETAETVGVTVKRRSTVTETKNKNKDKNTTNGDGLRIAPPPAPPLPSTTPTWSGEACDDWIARFEGTAPGGVIGRHLKPLVEKYGWPAVRAAWRAYLGETESQFANPARFAATYGTWKRAPAAPAAPPEPAPPPADPEAYQFFDAMKLRLSGTVPLQSHATWLRPVEGRAWEGACLVLACPSKEHAAQMRQWGDRLRAAAKELERDVTFRTVVIREPEYLHDGSIR